jgi:hypothetical protein
MVQPYEEYDEDDKVLFCFPLLMEHWWNKIYRQKPKYSEKILSQCHFVHHGLIQDRTRASAVTGWRLTA